MSLVVPAVLVLLGVAFAAWIYFGRELPVRGRGLLAAARAAILALLLLLLWNPAVPGGTVVDDTGPGMILLDGSLSMTALDASGTRAWDRALERVRTLDPDEGAPPQARLLLFGRGFQSFDAASPSDLVQRLDDQEPSFVASELAPALERAAEAGARSVTVVSDLRFGDAMVAREAAARLGLALSIEPVGVGVRNAGIAEFVAPRGVEAGEGVPVEVVLFGELPAGAPGSAAGSAGSAAGEDSITLTIREEDRLVATRTLPLPEAGRSSRLSLQLPPPQGNGRIEYRATLQFEGDGFALDDERIAHVTVDPDEGGIVLLSWRPDWEPRFLLPVLERVTGLDGFGYLRTGSERYLAMGAGPSGGGPIEEEALRRRMARADLLVLHGIDETAPAWVREAAERAGRLLLFPRDREGAAIGSVTVSDAYSGEWYAASDVPASPLAASLTGMELGALPPLARVLPLSAGQEGMVPLLLQLEGRGNGEAALVLRSEGMRRSGVVLASGFWRWGFREGPGRQSYRRLWAGVSGWLLGNEPLAGGPEVRPESSVLPRGVEISWRAQGMEGRALAVRVLREEREVDAAADAPAAATAEDSVVLDSILRVGGGATFQTPSLPPGRYRYIVNGEGPEGGSPAVEETPEVGAGSFRVEAYSNELATGPREFAAPVPSGGGGDSAGDRDGDATGNVDRDAERATRPLRTHPALFLLLIALLCGEWIGRRGKGLR